MNHILTVGFEFDDIFYYSLVRVKESDSETEYKITVMNGTLERLLLGNNVIRKKNSHLNIEMLEYSKQEQLKLAIAEALGTLLNKTLERDSKSDKFY